MPISRKKSCIPCRKAKARCNLASTCSHCSDRGLQCTYADAPIDQPSISTPWVNETGDFNLLDPGLEMEGISGVDLASNPTGIMVEDLGWPSPSWSEPNLCLSPSGGGVLGEIQSPPRSTPLSSDHQSADDQGVVIYGKVYHSLLITRNTTTGQSLIKNRIIWSQLKSYPSLLLEGRLPPFIYPACVLKDELPENCVVNRIHQCLPEPLAVCASLVGMFEVRTPASASFVWKSIYAEFDRLRKEYHTYDGDDLLATFQAIVIYLLLQVQDPQYKQQNDLGVIIVTLVDIVIRLGRPPTNPQNPYTQPNLTQRSWALNESRRRTIHTFYMLDTLLLETIVGTRSTVGCGGFDFVPLPAARVLWDYHTTESWASRFARWKSHRLDTAELNIGNLRMSGQGGADEAIASWCEDADEFGGLLWMCTSLN